MAAANAAAAGSADQGGSGSGSGSDDDGRASGTSGADQTEALQMAASTSAGSASSEAAAAGKQEEKEDDEVARLRAQLGQLKPRARGGKRGGQSEAVRLKRQARQKAENALVKVLKQVAERQVLSGV